MNAWGIFQLLLNLALISVGVAIYVRSKRPRKDDPRLSKGLQLLQSKIAILEDLSDRVDNQVKQLMGILDQKAKMTHEHAEMIQEHLNQVEKSIQKSLEVSHIFQDKIPHKEIIERQNTIKYIQAARLANQGQSVDEIAQKVDVPKSELEFIVKVNKDRLMFSEKDLPTWATNAMDLKKNEIESSDAYSSRDMTAVYEGLTLDKYIENEDKKIELDFKESVKNFETPTAVSSEENFVSTNSSEQFSDEKNISYEASSTEESVYQSYMPKSFDESELTVTHVESIIETSPIAEVSSPAEVQKEDSSIIEKIGSLVEEKLGFQEDNQKPQGQFQMKVEKAVSTAARLKTQPLKNDEAIRNTLKLKKEISKSQVKPFVFRRLDSDV